MSLRDDLHALADEIADQAESRLGTAVSSRMHPDGMADDSTVAELRDFLSSDRPIEGPDEIDAILCALNEVVGYYAEGVAFPDRPADGWCTRPDADHPTGDSWRHDGLTIRWIVNATLERLARQGLGDGQESSDPRWASDDGRRVLTVFEAGRKAAEGNPALRGAGDQAGARLLDELRHRGIEHRELFPLVAGIDLLAGLLRAEGPMSPVGATLDRAITAFAVGLGDVILEEAGR